MNSISPLNVRVSKRPDRESRSGSYAKTCQRKDGGKLHLLEKIGLEKERKVYDKTIDKERND
jgi:hypothetical protein